MVKWYGKWREKAACRGLPDRERFALFFPDSGSQAMVAFKKAKAICAECPVRTECIEAAIETDEHGTWGGTTRKQRLEIVAGKRPMP